ncbi:MAG: hypothetical protein ACLS3C_11015 [Oscillospiraceae bacterium]
MLFCCWRSFCVGGAVTLYRDYHDSLNLDAAKRFVRYLNVKTDSRGR